MKKYVKNTLSTFSKGFIFILIFTLVFMFFAPITQFIIDSVSTNQIKLSYEGIWLEWLFTIIVTFLLILVFYLINKK